jgi:hypothetical protein
MATPHNRCARAALCGALAVVLFSCAGLRAQIAPKTVDILDEMAPDGSATLTFNYAFDAGPWNQWRATVGNDPARLRAAMRYSFGANMAFDGFKMERDDLNRTAKMVMHTAVGCELRDDGRYSIPVDKDFRLVNNLGGTWFFSGNVAGALSTIKFTLPPGAIEPSLVSPGDENQALVYSLSQPHGKARRYLLAGCGLLAVGLVLLALGFRSGPSPQGNSERR